MDGLKHYVPVPLSRVNFPVS